MSVLPFHFRHFKLISSMINFEMISILFNMPIQFNEAHSSKEFYKGLNESAFPPQIGTIYIFLSLLHPFDKIKLISNEPV